MSNLRARMRRGSRSALRLCQVLILILLAMLPIPMVPFFAVILRASGRNLPTLIHKKKKED